MHRRFIVRDFKYDEDALQQQNRELEEAEATEREQQAELFRLARTNFGEVFSSWIHLKALRVFVESVLRYGLPPDFTAVTIAVSHKIAKTSHFRETNAFFDPGQAKIRTKGG